MAKPLSGIKQIAQRAGVHASTVSRVLNSRTRALVSDEVAARILKIAESLRYTRNPLAVGLKTRRSSTVGVIVPDLTNPAVPPLVRAVQHALEKESYVTILADAEGNPETERTILERLRARQVDGLILATALLKSEIVSACQEWDLPFVLVNRTVDDPSVTSVTTNDVEGVHLVVDHLVQLGHRKLAYVGGPLNTSTGRARRQGFIAALKAYRLKTREELIVDCASFSAQAGLAKARELLTTSKRSFTAIVSGNDLLALGVYDALAEAGLACPHDISVTGCNDMPFAARFNPPVTTLRVDYEEMGIQASQLLLRKMRDPAAEVPSVRLEPSLVVRGSTARLAKQ